MPFPSARPFPSHLGPRFQAIPDPAVSDSRLEPSVQIIKPDWAFISCSIAVSLSEIVIEPGNCLSLEISPISQPSDGSSSRSIASFCASR